MLAAAALTASSLPFRLAMISMHTSPLATPGRGQAGGMNVYLTALSRHLAKRGMLIDIYTMVHEPTANQVHELAPGVRVLQIAVPGACQDRPDDLLPYVPAFAAACQRVHHQYAPRGYDLVHTHYWLSGLVGELLAPQWQVPLVHTMHTLASVKNASLASGAAPESDLRLQAERQVVAAADLLVANTADEAYNLQMAYQANPDRIAVISPGVDLQVFHPGCGTRTPECLGEFFGELNCIQTWWRQRNDVRWYAREQLGIRAQPGMPLVVFAGRVQPLKAPDVLVRALAELNHVPGLSRSPSPHQVQLAVIGETNEVAGVQHGDQLVALAQQLGVSAQLQRIPALPAPELAQWFRAADVVAVPSYSESFGLVALEAAACATPVVAANVTGLSTAVADGISGILVDGHDPVDWATALWSVLEDYQQQAALSLGALRHAHRHSWECTAADMVQAYARFSERSSRVDAALVPSPHSDSVPVIYTKEFLTGIGH